MKSVDVHMRETDSMSWTMEADPVHRMIIVGVAVLDGTPDWSRLVERAELLTRAVPLFRQRIVIPPLRLAPPKLVVDRAFDLSWHVRRVTAPPPGTIDVVLRYAQRFATAAFDPVRPLWEVTLVEGLEGGRSALVMKVHHLLTDGIGGLQVLARLFDLTPLGDPVEPLKPPPDGVTDALRLLAGSIGFNVRRSIRASRVLAGAAGRTLAAARHDPIAAVSGAFDTLESIYEVVKPTRSPLSPVMRGRGLRREFRVLEIPLADLKAGARAIDGTVNDAFMSSVAGGLRRYHERHGATVFDLRVTLPVSLRNDDDPEGGNRITLIRYTIPVGVVDPIMRSREMHRRTERWKHTRALAYNEGIFGAVNWLPAAYLRSISRDVDFVASNVPGFPVPIYLAGARMVALYPFGPTGGTALNITMVSYDGTCFVAVNADAAAVPDVDELAGCLREGFDEIIGVARRRRVPRQREVRREPARSAR